ncbi:MAG TPA: DUF11 domain-containing protein, partial [Anaerolineae bacterium]|nr:DUF11 domain-containing protein [Anaerolineae bacterium]
MKRHSLSLALTLGLLVLVGMLILLGALGYALPTARAQSTIRYVAPTGNDTGDCTNAGSPCRTVQYAVDQANDGDEIRVAEGVYTGVQDRPVPTGYPSPPASGLIAQVVYISKTVTVRGGYTTADWNTSDPEANPTTLDAEGLGRGMVIAGEINSTVEGLRFTGGDAAGLGGSQWGDGGGGMYIIGATAIISNSRVFSNTAEHGGGLYLYYSEATLSGNTVCSNTAGDEGGGLAVKSGTATLSGNTVCSNTAEYKGGGMYLAGNTTVFNNTIVGNTSHEDGGGLHSYVSSITVISNTVSGNTAADEGGGMFLMGASQVLSNTITDNTAGGWGGGLSLNQATVRGNTISYNTAGWAGGGLYIDDQATVLNNIISHNTAGDGGGLELSGLYSLTPVDATIAHNTISDNTASGHGGGLCLLASQATLETNEIINNTAGDRGGGIYIYWSGYGSYIPPTLNANTIVGNLSNGSGGGIFLKQSDALLNNNLIADNQAVTGGSGLYLYGSSPHLRHTTIARNTGGGGHGLYLTNASGVSSNAVLTDTILVSHTVGITVAAGNTATLEATLWGSGAWANMTDWAGAGTVSTGTINLWGDPAFTDPDGGDYHIGSASAAVDEGVDAGLETDIDGDSRPTGLGFDIGADERPWFLHPVKVAWRSYVNTGEALTYTLLVTNVQTTTALNVLLTDTLPAEQRPLQVATSQGTCTPGSSWGAEVFCSLGDLGPESQVEITLTVEITTALPPTYPFQMRNVFRVKGDNTPTEIADAEVSLYGCHVRVNGLLPEYDTVQAGIAAANTGDTVMVAGICTGDAPLAYITKTVTLRGGYSADFSHWDPSAYPTVLDARQQGRVLYITGAISPTVEALHLTGGRTEDKGGGGYILSAAATISGCRIYGNSVDVASSSMGPAHGGGLYLDHSPATLTGNTISDNTVEASEGDNSGPRARGGGLYLDHSPATLTGNTISDNTAMASGFGDPGPRAFGGGLYLDHSLATLTGNTFQGNKARARGQARPFAMGGGIYLSNSDAPLSGNTFIGNEAWSGGGLYLFQSAATLSENTVQENKGTACCGGGLYLEESNATLISNTVSANTAVWDGGGLYLDDSDAVLTANIVSTNTATWDGGGLYLYYSDATLVSNTIAGNDGLEGGGLTAGNSDVLLTENLISGNRARGGDYDGGGGILVDFGSATLLDNVISNNASESDGGGILIGVNNVTAVISGNLII